VEGEELKRSVGSFLLLLALALPGRPDDAISFRGYLKSFSILLMPPAAILEGTTLDGPDLGAVNNRLRLGLTLRPSTWISFNCEYDVSPRIQDARLFDESLFLPGLKLAEYRLTDLRDRLYPGPGETPASFGIYQNLDRFVFTIKTSAADIILGRQAVAWGSARVVNPTDVLAPFAFNELDKEERTGVDALRVRIPLGAMEELDIGVVAGDKLKAENNAYFLRGKMRAFKTDVSVMAMAFRNHLLLGLDLARSIGGAGAWLEAAYVIPEALLKNGTGDDKNYFRASVGVDYNLGPKTYGFVEYHFNSAGGNEPEAYLSSVGTTPFRDGAVYLLGRHYASVGSTYQITPLLPFTGLLIANLGDLSLVFAPSIDYNISQNIYLSGGAYIGVGKRPEILAGSPDPTPQPDLLHSEFGSYPDMLYASFRVYF
jgi:hypothetical protein